MKLHRGGWTYDLGAGTGPGIRFRDREEVRILLAPFLADPTTREHLVLLESALLRGHTIPASADAGVLGHLVSALASGFVRVRALPRMRGSGMPVREEAADSQPAAEEPAPATERVPVDLYIRLAINPNDASTHDDKFVVTGSDGYRSEKTVRDDQVPGDNFVDLHYTGLYEDQSYTLEVIEAPGAAPQALFRDVPYPSLVGLSQSGPGRVAAVADPTGDYPEDEEIS